MISDWVHVAKKLSVYFAQVREDALIDLHVLQQYAKPNASIMMVASGGCTACFLSQHANLYVIDPNPSQLELTRLKLGLLNDPHRLELLGHKTMESHVRKKELQRYACNFDLLGGIDLISELGLDYIGRFEMLFQALRNHLKSYRKRDLEDAFEEVMSLSNLIELFGEKATANRVQPFFSHFAEKTYAYVSTPNARFSPYLAQVLAGKFFDQNYTPWLLVQNHSSQEVSKEVSYYCGTMQEALQNYDTQFDMIHLSNIVDWLSIKEAQELLTLAYAALKKGGALVLRQLNSNLDIPNLCQKFSWNLPLSKKLHTLDRSFLYRNLYIGEKQ